MENEKTEEKELEHGDIEVMPMNIIDEQKQLSVRIPKKFVDALEISPEKDMVLFILYKEDLHLEAILMSKDSYQKEFKNGKDKR